MEAPKFTVLQCRQKTVYRVQVFHREIAIKTSTNSSQSIKLQCSSKRRSPNSIIPYQIASKPSHQQRYLNPRTEDSVFRSLFCRF